MPENDDSSPEPNDEDKPDPALDALPAGVFGTTDDESSLAPLAPAREIPLRGGAPRR